MITVKVEIGGAAAQLELRGVADKRMLYLVAEVVKFRAGISSMAEGTSGRIGEEGGERAEEEGDGGAECGVMESSVDAPLQEAQFTPAQMEAMHVEMSRRIVPLQQRYERVREFFFKEFVTNTGESSMSTVPSLQSSCLPECVFVGLVDRVQHSSFCDFCMIVIS